MTVVLYAYQYSVYSWIARLVLGEKGVSHDYIEVNPFAPEIPAEYVASHPFRRVPTLMHDDFALYETGALTRYIDETFEGPILQPSASRPRARMAQIISIIDSYGYWPMVRQVFSHGVFRPRTGQPISEDEIRSGIISSERVLGALEALAEPKGYLIENQLSLADLHLAPMMAYFTGAQEGQATLDRYKRLSAWWERIRSRRVFVTTNPGLPAITVRTA
jgi:glutathione S-transferase